MTEVEQFEAILAAGGTLPPMDETPVVTTTRGKGSRKAKRAAADRFGVLNQFIDIDNGITPTDAIVWFTLYRDTKPPYGTATTSQADIARRWGLSARTVRRSIERLISRGLAERIRRGNHLLGSSTYRVHPVPKAKP